MKMGPKIHLCGKNELTYPDGDFIIGLSGEIGTCIEMADYFRNPELWGGKPPRVNPRTNLMGLVLTDQGRMYTFNADPGKWILVREKYAAMGSGMLTALGALSVGATAKEAVLAASKVDPFTGMGTKVLSFK